MRVEERVVLVGFGIGPGLEAGIRQLSFALGGKCLNLSFFSPAESFAFVSCFRLEAVSSCRELASVLRVRAYGLPLFGAGFPQPEAVVIAGDSFRGQPDNLCPRIDSEHSDSGRAPLYVDGPMLFHAVVGHLYGLLVAEIPDCGRVRGIGRDVFRAELAAGDRKICHVRSRGHFHYNPFILEVHRAFTYLVRHCEPTLYWLRGLDSPVVVGVSGERQLERFGEIPGTADIPGRLDFRNIESDVPDLHVPDVRSLFQRDADHPLQTVDFHGTGPLHLH